MFLAEVEPHDAVAAGLEIESAIASWAHFPSSEISAHPERCCTLAQEWLLAMDYSQLGGADVTTGPRWIRQRYTWGPNRWPLHWCEVWEKRTLDCGALAALSKAAFSGRGLRAYTAQLIQQYTEQDGAHWCSNWQQDGAQTSWLRGRIVYHEACAVIQGGDQMKIWDATGSSWLDPRQSHGYGSVLAVRILVSEEVQIGRLAWGDRGFWPNQWQKLEPASSGEKLACVSATNEPDGAPLIGAG